MTKEEFIARAEAKYGKGTYSYDEVNYVNNRTPVKIRCNNCGTLIEKRPYDFLRGFECHCQLDLNRPTYHPKYFNLNTFIKAVNEKFGEGVYDLSGSTYLGSREEIRIFCNDCKTFIDTMPRNFIRSIHGCQCHNPLDIDTEGFKVKAKEKFGDLYSYDESKYVNTRTPLKIHCNECGEDFYRTPHEFLSGGFGCPVCMQEKNESSGEKLVRSILGDLNISSVTTQYRVTDKIEGRKMNLVIIDFQFFLDSGQEVWIEYNGKQHYKYNHTFEARSSQGNETPQEHFNGQLRRDKNVRDYCQEQGILLIEIPYTYSDYEVIKSILSDVLFNGKSPEDLIVYPKIDDICMN